MGLQSGPKKLGFVYSLPKPRSRYVLAGVIHSSRARFQSIQSIDLQIRVMDAPDRADEKAAFRKPSNDKANRKYRRHSSTSISPPPAGIHERRSDNSINVSRKEPSKITDHGHNKKDDNRELDQTSGRSGRSGDSYRHDRHSSRSSRDYRRHDDYREEGEREHSRSALRSASDSRDGRYYDRVKNEDDYKRPRDSDKYNRPREIYDAASHKSNHTEREFSYLSVGKDRYTREKDGRNETRSSRSTLGDNRTGRSSHDDPRANRSDSTFVTEASGSHSFAAPSDVFDVVEYQKTTKGDKKRFGNRETKLTTEYDTRGSREDKEDVLDSGDPPPLSLLKKSRLASFDKTGDLKNSEDSQGIVFKASTQPSSGNNADNNSNLDAAKVAAMRAAELVNKNLVGVGVTGALSTDQKKKLLWGSKKKAVEESSHCWDASLFPDREQQEKFNRLMGVKGEAKAEQKSTGNQEGKSILDAEKQKELQLDLERQYTAGLRRRDGRTVGLGL